MNAEVVLGGRNTNERDDDVEALTTKDAFFDRHNSSLKLLNGSLCVILMLRGSLMTHEPPYSTKTLYNKFIIV